MSNIKAPQSARPRYIHPGENYSGYTAPELAPFAARKGAMDAYALPSLALGQVVYPRGAEAAKAASQKS